MDNIQRNIENQDCDPDRVLWERSEVKLIVG